MDREGKQKDLPRYQTEIVLAIIPQVIRIDAAPGFGSAQTFSQGIRRRPVLGFSPVDAHRANTLRYPLL